MRQGGGQISTAAAMTSSSGSNWRQQRRGSFIARHDTGTPAARPEELATAHPACRPRPPQHAHVLALADLHAHHAGHRLHAQLLHGLAALLLAAALLAARALLACSGGGAAKRRSPGRCRAHTGHKHRGSYAAPCNASSATINHCIAHCTHAEQAQRWRCSNATPPAQPQLGPTATHRPHPGPARRRHRC